MLLMNPHPTLSLYLMTELSRERTRAVRRGQSPRINRP
jgi:hypothetical protein